MVEKLTLVSCGLGVGLVGGSWLALFAATAVVAMLIHLLGG